MIDPEDTHVSIDRSLLADAFPNPKVLAAMEKIFRAAGLLTDGANEAQLTADTADGKAEAAQDDADDALTTIAAVRAAQFVVLAGSTALTNERVLSNGTGVAINTATPGQVTITVDVLTLLNAAAINLSQLITATAGAHITGGLEVDTLRLDQAETVAAVVSDRWVPININGSVRKLLLAS